MNRSLAACSALHRRHAALVRAIAAAALLAPVPAHLAQAAPPAGALRAARLDVQATTTGSTPLSEDARHLLDWIVHSNDHGGAAFVIVDKKSAAVLVFDADARLHGRSPVLLGSALGDDSVHGIGSRPIAQVLPEERTTPAGRFMAEPGRNTAGEDVVWVDYEAAVSMHRVRTGNAAEQRAHRLATPSIDDNRISYGCINVPVPFYEAFIRPLFSNRRAVVYVLPDLKPVRQVFGSYPVARSLPVVGALIP